MVESTFVDIDDTGIQSLETAMTEADGLIENGDESGAGGDTAMVDERCQGHLPQGAASGWPVTVLCG